VTPDRVTPICVHDGPDPESIRRAATRNGPPVDSISEVRFLDRYCYIENLAAARRPGRGVPAGCGRSLPPVPGRRGS